VARNGQDEDLMNSAEMMANRFLFLYIQRNFPRDCVRRGRTRVAGVKRRPEKKEGVMASESEVKAFAGKKMAAGICGILIGSLGIHKFILGLTTPGIIMLLVTLLTCGVGGVVMGVIGLIEGIMYLMKSDEEFYQLYAVEKKGWF
jgi:TM2 domain-containing membrane protein YozV